MNHFQRLGACLVLLGMPLLGYAAGCIIPANLDDCTVYPHAGCAGGSGGDDGGPPPGCVPSENVEPVDDTCGVFVSSSLGDDSNTGSKSKPMKTLGAALALAKGRPVYACGESFVESVSIGQSVTLYGGLACAKGWTYDVQSATLLTAKADLVPMTVNKSTTNVEVSDFAITAADAVEEGGSSIAVVVAQAAVSFARCEVTAGNGKAGAAGEAFETAAMGGGDGLPGAEACKADQSFGGKAVTNACSSADSVSGAGGIGDTNSGGDGSDGKPAGSMNGGIGEDVAACTKGTAGDAGSAGTAGSGATGLGTLNASGYTGVTGGEGGPGKVAQGGGGGGGAKGGTGTGKCADAAKAGGASGGSGGAGGCGGLGGKGGMPGGSSIAIMSLDATLTFSSVTLKTGNGGAGGNGGDGQTGGLGGTGGPGGAAKPMYSNLNDACPGGPGGKGGNGGKGGGGLGGHAIGIAATGKAPATTGVVFLKGAAGAGGKGDNANGNMGDGAGGVVADVEMFP